MSRAQTKIIFFGENKNGAQFAKHLVTFGGVQMFGIIWTFRTKPRGHFHAAEIEDKSHIWPGASTKSKQPVPIQMFLENENDQNEKLLCSCVKSKIVLQTIQGRIGLSEGKN